MIDLEKNNDQPTEQEVQEFVNHVYDYAADLLVNKGLSKTDAKKSLVSQGLDEAFANTVVENLQKQIDEAKSKQADKDIMYGLAWAAGGVILTAITGGAFIFWGAVVYGIYKIGSGIAHKS